MILELLALAGPSIVVVAIYVILFRKETRNSPIKNETKKRHPNAMTTTARLLGCGTLPYGRLRQNQAEQKIQAKVQEINEAIKRLQEHKQ